MPSITRIFPTFGRSVTTFRVFGTGFTGASAVTIGGASASFVVESSTVIRVTSGTTSGAVAVTQGTTATGPEFTVTRWPSDFEIVNALADLVAEVDPDAKVIPYRALLFRPELGENARILKNADGQIRSWMVFLDAISRADSPTDSPNGKPGYAATQAQRLDLTLSYAVWGFYAFEAGSESVNSHDLLRDVTLRLCDTLRAEPDLRLTDGRGDDKVNIRNHGQLTGDFPRIAFGQQEIEVARMRLDVRIFVN